MCINISILSLISLECACHPTFPFIETKVGPGRLLKKIYFERSIMTPETKQHIDGLARQQGKGGLWFCGVSFEFKWSLRNFIVDKMILVPT